MGEQMDDNQAAVLEKALTRFIDQCMQGEPPDVDAFADQYPECESQLKERIRDLQEIDVLFDSLVQADENEFEDARCGQDLVGQRLANFEVERVIGRGGMGIVYLARDTRLKRSVAIKSMPVKLQANSTAQIRFRREAELLASLNHPNIAVIHEIVEEGDSGYLILEYVPGETLAERVAREPLKLEEALTVGRQIAEAISAAHENGVIHRDLKPGNIKITPDGRVKVLDFGLAKASISGGRSSEITVTQPGRVMGTPAYMSPEQARGKETDHRTDIWSFGCILYQMLTSHLPFEGDTATDTLAHIIEREPDWERLPHNIPVDIRALLRSCLEKDRDNRPKDITSVADRISEALSLLSISRPATVVAKPQKVTMIVGALVVMTLCTVLVCFMVSEKTPSPPSEIGLAVLPFENLGPAEDEYLVNGMTDEVRTRLGVIYGLRVIGRQSSTPYKDSQMSAREIAAMLNVDYLLEGTIRRQRPPDPNSSVKVNIRLVRASDEFQVWALPRDDDTCDVLDFQSKVAERVAQELDIALLPPERKALVRRQTASKKAYDCYLKGNGYLSGTISSEDGRTDAINMYQEAIALDPNFVSAYKNLSNTYTSLWWFIEKDEDYLAKAREYADTALRLNYNDPGAHVVLGRYYYQGLSNYDSALKEFAIAQKSHPNHVWMLTWTSYVQRRQGKFDQALANLRRAYGIDPHSTDLVFGLANTLTFLRHYQDALHYWERVISLAPDKPKGYIQKAWLYLTWKGSIPEAREVVNEALRKTENATEHPEIQELLVTLDIYSGDYEEALKRVPLESEDSDWLIRHTLRRAEIYGYLEDTLSEQEYYRSAVDILKKELAEDPTDHSLHSSLGIAQAGLGSTDEAIMSGERGKELLPVTTDAWEGPIRVEDLARIYVMLGKHELAIRELEALILKPSRLSIHSLLCDPVWRPLQDHPDFDELIEKGRRAMARLTPK